MKKLIILTLCAGALAISGCTKKHEDLKSPCVGLEDSPCGPKRSVNDWWLA